MSLFARYFEIKASEVPEDVNVVVDVLTNKAQRNETIETLKWETEERCLTFFGSDGLMLITPRRTDSSLTNQLRVGGFKANPRKVQLWYPNFSYHMAIHG